MCSTNLFKLAFLLPLGVFFAGCRGDEAPPRDQAQDTSWRLVWADEFDGTAIDTTKWTVVIGDGCDVGICGWGNDELQWYDRDNVAVEGGTLRLIARKDSMRGYAYTSGKLQSRFKGDWKYGRFEVRAKLPAGAGYWPAIWMLPTDATYGGWAASGEIDIMEAVGKEPSRIYATLHHGGAWPNNRSTPDSLIIPAGLASADFHTYAIEWDAASFAWFFDGNEYARQTVWSTAGHDYPAPFDQRFHMILNLAVGGNWPGPPDTDTVFPQPFEVDFVRVYQRRD